MTELRLQLEPLVLDSPLRIVMMVGLQEDGPRHDGVLQEDGASRRPPFKSTARHDGPLQDDGAS
jgi:hypothetical protein